MKLQRIILSVAAATMLVAQPLAAAEGWGMPNLNPFASKGKAATRSRVSDSKSSLWPKWGGGSTRRSNTPSTWNRVTTGTKNTWNKTTSAINPWDKKPAARTPQQPTGSFNPFSQTASTSSAKKAKTEKQSSILPSWISGEDEEPERPKTVNDFLAQPTPDF